MFQMTVSLSWARPRSRSRASDAAYAGRAQRLEQLVDAAHVGLAVHDVAAERPRTRERAPLQTP